MVILLKYAHPLLLVAQPHLLADVSLTMAHYWVRLAIHAVSLGSDGKSLGRSNELACVIISLKVMPAVSLPALCQAWSAAATSASV